MCAQHWECTFLWSTDSKWIAFGCSLNVCRTNECCSLPLGYTSPHQHFSHFCMLHPAFMYRCGHGFVLILLSLIFKLALTFIPISRGHNLHNTLAAIFLPFIFSPVIIWSSVVAANGTFFVIFGCKLKIAKKIGRIRKVKLFSLKSYQNNQ